MRYVTLQMAQRKKWHPERMKAAIEAITNNEMSSYKASRFFIVPQTTLERYMREREKSSNEAIKTKLSRKQVLTFEAENDLTGYFSWNESFFGLTIATPCFSLTNLL
jgi:uncharacterized HAD superfamily protein